MLESNGSKHLTPPEQFVYWVNEREKIRFWKEAKIPKPWSDDKVFQTTYFCNIRREHDKVTRWIRTNWLVDDANYEFAMVLARLINRPSTLQRIGYPYKSFTDYKIEISIENVLQAIEEINRECQLEDKPFWGNAYIVTTHGQRMDKVQYLLNVLGAAYEALPIAGVPPTCAAYHAHLKQLEGFGDFMAAQVVADLKNTAFHPLAGADDFWSFCAPGPGSKRGLEWYFGKKVPFKEGIQQVEFETRLKIPMLCMQDLQNCLCEFDKYMRVYHGTGRSKRGYNGH